MKTIALKYERYASRIGIVGYGVCKYCGSALEYIFEDATCPRCIQSRKGMKGIDTNRKDYAVRGGTKTEKA